MACESWCRRISASEPASSSSPRTIAMSSAPRTEVAVQPVRNAKRPVSRPFFINQFVDSPVLGSPGRVAREAGKIERAGQDRVVAEQFVAIGASRRAVEGRRVVHVAVLAADRHDIAGIEEAALDHEVRGFGDMHMLHRARRAVTMMMQRLRPGAGAGQRTGGKRESEKRKTAHL